MANVLKPDVMWVQGRCYRVNDSSTEATDYQEHDLYEDEVTFKNIEDEHFEDEDFKVEMIDENRYSTSLHVSKHYVGSIIGRKGAIKNRIERDTKTEIKIPRQGQSGDVVIFGPSEANVKAARRRINVIVISSRMKQQFTHFISVPMHNSTIMENYQRFKESVLRECADSRDLDESLFVKPIKMHVTVGVMCLMDNEERTIASKLFTEAMDTIIAPALKDHMPYKISLKGLSYMNDDPSEIDVLYGEVHEVNAPKGTLQNISDALVDHFYKAGFMDRENDHVKLHVTLINSKFRQRSSTSLGDSNSKSRNSGKRLTFDGSKILEKFADYDFGVMDVEEFHLSQRYGKRSDGYYQPSCVVTCKKS
ncbi:activating signal cointegrator 1 complex subunit 1 [Hyposmocoma kahamanoa]|uniref:activating signal cointegrator 1 complex subunit 1 n=1 Tax=Hyposmocoma kahamanoa TaxID=1477025 RepID=UPI000E6D9D09|nr:activating signal cointegrator 1 complex subunit 1 [Hyposmocoma kahamanoa]